MIALLSFPSPDPIPLPAPVLLFKLLHGAVLTLHFVTVQWVLGWILIGSLWNLLGRCRGDAVMTESSVKLAGSLPVLMTYLINFGIPPLLFTQVLYGNFLYSSSVLIGAWWISVVFLVIAAYSMLYAGNARAAKARAWWGFGSGALIVGIAIAMIYSTNMTLMLRPAVWTEMFRLHPSGTVLPPHDATIVPRWLLMLASSVMMGGLTLVVTGIWQKNTAEVKAFMVRQGGWLMAFGTMLQLAAGFQVFQTQPGVVLSRLAENRFYQWLPSVWVGLAVGLIPLGLWAVVRREKATGWLATGMSIIGFLGTATMVIYRDAIRDSTLWINAGYNAWDLKVVPNWPIVSLFLGTFVVGLLVIAWLISIALKSKPILDDEPIQSKTQEIAL
jgi:hypothetical protein